MYRPGRIIGGAEPTRSGAPGLWTPDEILVASKRNIWPTQQDPYFSSVTALFHFDGENGTETWIDKSSSGLTIANYHTSGTKAILSNTQAKFGTTSCFFPASGGIALRTGATGLAPLGFGTGDYTVEFFVYLSSLSTEHDLLDMRPGGINGNTILPYIYSSAGGLRLYFNGADVITGSNGTMTTGSWIHIAVARSGTSTKMFANGTQVGSTWSDSNTYSNGALTIGSNYGGSVPIRGYMDAFRITKGVCRYPSNFTVPTTQFPDY